MTLADPRIFPRSMQAHAGFTEEALFDAELASVSIDELYRRLRRHVPRVAASMLGGAAPPSDLVDDAISAVVLSLPRYRHDCGFRSWVHAVVQRHVQKWIRSQQRHRRLLREAALTGRPEPVVGPDDATAIRQVCRQLELLLPSLPERQLLCMLLTAVEGLSSEVVAQQLGITSAAVRTNACRARAQLRKSLDGTSG